MLSHTTLAEYYKTLFALREHHDYQFSEIENLIPYERDIYIDMLLELIQKRKDKAGNQ